MADYIHGINPVNITLHIPEIYVGIKKLNPNAVIPQYAKDGDAGLDLVATSFDGNAMFIEYGTGLAVEIPHGYVGLLFPRSSVSVKHLSLANSVGVIDSGYRGEIKLRFKNTCSNGFSNMYAIGEKVGQLIVIPYPKVNFKEVTELSDSDRGNGGFGSTGV